MSKFVARANYRVVIEAGIGYSGDGKKTFAEKMRAREADGKRTAESIFNDVRRHIDDIGDVYVQSDDASRCEYCGSGWTEESTTYNGGCCDKDEEGNPDNTEAA